MVVVGSSSGVLAGGSAGSILAIEQVEMRELVGGLRFVAVLSW